MCNSRRKSVATCVFITKSATRFENHLIIARFRRKVQLASVIVWIAHFSRNVQLTSKISCYLQVSQEKCNSFRQPFSSCTFPEKSATHIGNNWIAHFLRKVQPSSKIRLLLPCFLGKCKSYRIQMLVTCFLRRIYLYISQLKIS